MPKTTTDDMRYCKHCKHRDKEKVCSKQDKHVPRKGTCKEWEDRRS